MLIVNDDGDLYRYEPGKHACAVRKNFSRTHAMIRSVADLKATLRAGAYAWPGGYPLYFVCDDGGSLSFRTVRQEYRLVADAIRRRDGSGGWRVIACGVNWEDRLTDSHTGEEIESAYLNEEDAENDA